MKHYCLTIFLAAMICLLVTGCSRRASGPATHGLSQASVQTGSGGDKCIGSWRTVKREEAFGSNTIEIQKNADAFIVVWFDGNKLPAMENKGVLTVQLNGDTFYVEEGTGHLIWTAMGNTCEFIRAKQDNTQSSVPGLPSGLEVEFGSVGNYGASLDQEVQVRPGGPTGVLSSTEFSFGFNIRNATGKPLKNVGVAVEPATAFRLWRRLEGSKNTRPADARFHCKDKLVSGKPIIRGVVLTTAKPIEIVYPDGDPHYPNGWGNSMIRVQFNGLACSESAKPGSDIEVKGYVLLNGSKIPVGSVVVHVMHE